MKYNIFFIIVLNLILYLNLIGQSDCIEKCYINRKFEKSSQEFSVSEIWKGNVDIVNLSQPIVYDIEGDGIPELLMPNFISSFSLFSNEILVIDSQSGQLKYTIKTPYFDRSYSSFIVADLEKNCEPKIIIVCANENINPTELRKRLVCIDLEGDINWISDITYQQNRTFRPRTGLTLGLADFNLDGISEVYLNNEIFNAHTGQKLADGGDNGKGIQAVGVGGLSVAANIDEDPELELVAGYTVYKVSINNLNGTIGNLMTPINMRIKGNLFDGNTSVADINQDGRLDIIVSTSGFFGHLQNLDIGVYCYTIENNQAKLLADVGRYKPNTIWRSSGPVSIFYNKETEEMNLVWTVYGDNLKEIVCFSFINGNTTLQKNWDYPIFDTFTHMVVSIFDLNADNIEEIIFRDEWTLKILNIINNTPVVLFEYPCKAGTAAEMPIIADIDSKGEAKICISCEDTVINGGFLHVFGAPEGQRWAPARKIWHQYGYNPLFINDNGTVPQFQNNHATYQNGKYNNFLVQESLIDEDGNYPAPAASLSVTADCVGFDTFSNKFLITFSVHNQSKASLTAPINLPISFYDGNPETDGVLLGTYFTMAEIASDSSLNGLTFSLDAQNLYKLFIVVNTDMVSPLTTTGASFLVDECDYTDNIYQILLPKTIQETKTICQSETIEFFGSELNNSGLYFYKIEGQYGCDSIIHSLDLSVVDTVNTFINETACNSYFWNNQTYTQSGLYTYQTINANGCDSIATLDLTIFKSSDENISDTACDSYFWNNQTYTQSGLYTFQTTNQYGCDSLISLDLTVNSSHQQTITHTTCDDYTWNGQTYNQSGVYTYATTNQFGCDSILTLDLTINNTILTNETQTACDAYFWNNQTYTQSGLYTYQTINANGCDSIATLDLTIFKSSDENISHIACDSYFWNNQIYTQSGLYTFQTTNQYGCDSIISLDLTVNPSHQQTITHTTCDDYTWNGQTYNQSGVYTYATTNQFGCDSILTLDLTINNTIYFSETQTACDAYFWNNQTYTHSGLYTYQTINGDGCDSIATLELTIFESNSNNIFQSACQSFEYENQILTESGIYTFNLQNSFGCDSIVTLELEILDQFTSQSVSSCDQYIWPANGQTYLQSGVYTDTLQNIFGCDSVIQLDLNISLSFNIPDQKEVCDQYFWTPNNTTYTQSGFYQLDLKTAQGCDSILTLDLTIHSAFMQIDTVTSNTEYIWQINNTTYTTSGIYTEKWLTPADCDSIHQLLLTIKTDSDIYFPNIILPNSQNSNFTIFGSNSIELIQSLSIYDRWSNLVFHQENFPPNQASLGWNGKFRGQPVIPGVYVWTAQIKLSDGTTLMKTGDVTVVE